MSHQRRSNPNLNEPPRRPELTDPIVPNRHVCRLTVRRDRGFGSAADPALVNLIESLSPAQLRKASKRFAEICGKVADKNSENAAHGRLVPSLKITSLRNESKGVIHRRENPNARIAVPLKTRLRVLERGNWTCAHCGSDRKLEVDHIFPVSAGGSNREENLQVLCKHCNNRKYSKVPLGVERI